MQSIGGGQILNHYPRFVRDEPRMNKLSHMSFCCSLSARTANSCHTCTLTFAHGLGMKHDFLFKLEH
jgi:hypothetical protein